MRRGRARRAQRNEGTGEGTLAKGPARRDCNSGEGTVTVAKGPRVGNSVEKWMLNVDLQLRKALHASLMQVEDL